MRVQLSYSSPYDHLYKVTKDIAVTSMTWVRNGVGTATIDVPTSHPDLQRLVEWGNIFRLNSLDVRPWVGQMVSREWSNGVMHLGCKSAEWMLQGKLTGQGKLYGASGGEAAGGVAASLFYNAAIANNDIRVLQPGVFTASQRVFREYNYEDLFKSWEKLAADCGADFWVDEYLRAHFTDQRGRNLADTLVLREGRHLSDVRVVESAEEILTAAVGIGDEISGSIRPTFRLRYTNSPFFRAQTISVSGAKDESALEWPVRSALTEKGEPRLAVDANILKINGSYGDFWIGDIITLVVKHPLLQKINVRVIGLEKGTGDVLRGIFEVIPAVSQTTLVPWTLA